MFWSIAGGVNLWTDFGVLVALWWWSSAPFTTRWTTTFLSVTIAG